MSHRQQRIISPQVAEYPPGHWSNCIRVGDAIYLSGFTSRGSDLKTIHSPNDCYEQTKVIFTKVKHCLEAAGAKMSDVVNMTIFVTDIALNKEVWRARREFFTGDFPCSTLVQVAALGAPEILVEIQVQAHAGSGV
jgi:2-iminobutanoate/2-iminopropanoate deaminase